MTDIFQRAAAKKKSIFKDRAPDRVWEDTGAPPPDTPTPTRRLELARLEPNGKIDFRPHPGQWQAWNSEKRFVTVLAGTQGGKTSFGPHWLYREIQRQGPGDYLIVTPTFQLLEKKLLPEFKRLFESWLRLGNYVASPSRRFNFSKEGEQRTFTPDQRKEYPDIPTVVWFGYAEDPESLESATAKAAWCDEAGQKKFKLAAWEAIRRRLSLNRGRVLITTTPYDLGWLKQNVYDKWRLGDPNYDVIRFDSTENPLFSQEEFDEVKAVMPAWKFDLFYRGIFTRPAGQIYDSFKDELYPEGHLWPRFDIPIHWRRYVGIDFGGVHTAAVFFAEERYRGVPTGRFILYRTYHGGGRDAAAHARLIRRSEPPSLLAIGGAKSEDQWRREFQKGGLTVLEPPIKDVEVGIDRVYGAHQQNQILVFDDLVGYREQKTTYSRETDDQGEPTDKIEDKGKFHYLDAERYVVSYLKRNAARQPIAGGQRTSIKELSSRIRSDLGETNGVRLAKTFR